MKKDNKITVLLYIILITSFISAVLVPYWIHKDIEKSTDAIIDLVEFHDTLRQ